MWVPSNTYEGVAAFVAGYDAACEGGVLVGFREWLLVRKCHGKGSNLAWYALVLDCAFPTGSAVPPRALTDEGGHLRAIEVLFTLLGEFDDEVRESRNGLAKIFEEYARIAP